MKRKFYNTLLDWKNTNIEMPLMVIKNYNDYFALLYQYV